MMIDPTITNILMAGVGGQGTLLASEILSEVLMQAGYDVKKAEVHGMAQRGGSVVLFGFELLETYRYLPLLKKDGAVVVNNLKIAPPSVALGHRQYPQDLEQKLQERVADLRIVDGLALAERAGNPRTVNTVLLGALSNTLAPSHEQWLSAIRSLVPERFLDVNLKAFELGRQVR
jgi:indolepyruvate ferredoxin oxidoreductase beta subunit